METAKGEIDVRQLQAIIGRRQALMRRGGIPMIEGASVIQSLCDDLTTLLIAFGCEVVRHDNSAD